MAALTFDDAGHRTRRRNHAPGWIAPAILVGAAVAVLAFFYFQAPSFDPKAARDKVINVVLPPPPPPPPPKEKPPEPEKKVIEEETPQPPTPQPKPPTPDQPPAPTSDAPLTAREGAGPSNYGLAKGNGGGIRIGGSAPSGDNGFGAYARGAVTEITRAAQSDPAISRGGRFLARLQVTVSPEGRITSVRFLEGTGDDKRDQALQRKLIGLMLSQRPPAGLPSMRIELGARSGT